MKDKRMDYIFPRSRNNVVNWHYILTIGFLVRFLILFIVFQTPLTFGPSPPISPLHYQTGIDLSEYLTNTKYYSSFDEFVNVMSIYKAMVFEGTYPNDRLLGPVYPMILNITNYTPGNTLILSILIFSIELMSFFIWLQLLKNRLTRISGLLLALMPHSIWFAIVISSDIFFYFLSTFFFLVVIKKIRVSITLIPICLLLLLSKPTGIAFSISALFLPSIYFNSQFQHNIIRAVLILLVILFTFLYLPYFLVDQTYIDNSPELTQISRHQFDITLLIMKFAHLFGLHNSESGIIITTVLRFFYGIIFIFGFINIFKAELWLKVLISLIIGFVIFTHVPTWRYLLPLFPIFLVEGNHFIKRMFKSICIVINRKEVK